MTPNTLMKPLKILALALFAAGTWWIAFTQEPEAPVQTTKPGHKIDYFLKHFEPYRANQNNE